MIKKFKIIHTESSCGWGGQELRIINEALELKKSNFDIEIWANPESKILRESAKAGLKCRAVDLRKKRPWTLFRLIKILNHEPDSTIFSCHSSTDHWLIALARLLSRKKFRIIRYRHISAPLKLNFASKWLYRSGCDRIITTSMAIARNIVKHYDREPSSVNCIPTGVDTSLFCRSRDTCFAKSLINIPNEITLLGTVSTLRSWKGHELLLDVFSTLPNLSRYILVIVGEGPFKERIESRISALNLNEYVRLVGHKEDVRPYLEALDVFLFPSYANEGVPQAVLQAMCYDLAVVASDLPGIEEALDGYENVTFFQSGVRSSLRESLISTLETIETMQPDTSKQSLENISERISINRMTARLKEVYYSLAK
jgi:glycosyltransferase involved in cell wall biosynthesis